jgi:hypothetical protein
MVWKNLGADEWRRIDGTRVVRVDGTWHPRDAAGRPVIRNGSPVSDQSSEEARRMCDVGELEPDIRRIQE